MAESARDRLPVSFWAHVDELNHLAGKVTAVMDAMWEESGLNEERECLTPVYRDLLISVCGEAQANEILMDLASRSRDE